jgi:hypothetical protein
MSFSSALWLEATAGIAFAVQSAVQSFKFPDGIAPSITNACDDSDAHSAGKVEHGQRCIIAKD